MNEDRFRFRYFYGIPGKQETIFFKDFHLDDIGGGCDHINELCDSPGLKDYRILHTVQNTGLRDKNGVVAWEGDIIKKGTTFTVVTWDRGQGSWYCRTKSGFPNNYLVIIRGEVIGNIYQNSELLEQ